MPGTPQPVVDPRFGTVWTGVSQVQRAQKQLGAALASIAQAQLASIVISSVQPPGSFAPSIVNDVELVSTVPTATATIGTSGQAIVTVTGTVSLSGTVQTGSLYVRYTPEGGIPTEPTIAEFGTGSAISLASTVTGTLPLKNLPTGTCAFQIYAASAGTVGASFSGIVLTVQPQ
jgi:hypothetical protein